MNGVEDATMIGKSVKISGDLSGSEDLTMNGELQGTIRLAGSCLTIGPKARIRGDIAAKDVVVSGLLDGDIHATGRVTLRSSAVVQGNIYAGAISIEENAALRGQVDPSRSQEPMPEKPAVASRMSAGSSVGSSTAPRQLPVALAAVAARTAIVDASEDASERSLFAKTEA